ncbi:MAG: GTP-binding protein [Candidatus Bathyarchaeota archaeon]|nr:GTP-binding protein [Candidatus Bathyarchaeota archaeon]
MPRFRQIAEILKLMGKKEQIRNLGVIAHIDHGKTTLTDSLLVGAGLLSSTATGPARVLDYLEEEQKRGITMKTANISLLYRTASGSFVINLVDTPGHVDFTGKVTRALRAIDGAIVVVDAVEEIMAQTEIVVRQALEERVRPVLFINKVDRLITELKLTAEQIQKKFTRIIGGFNDLIEIYGESPFKEKWKVDAAKNSVAFGSALHRWGFTLNTAKVSNMKFSDVIAAYEKAAHEELQKTLPLHTVILDMAVNHIPNPLEAQKYRLEKIWRGNLSSEIGQAMLNCDDNGAAVMCITNVQADPQGGLTATGRLFSGTLKTGAAVYLVNANVEGVISQVSIFMGAFKEPVNQVTAGNVAALSGLTQAKAGETLVASEHKAEMAPFERISYVSEPVLTVAVEAKNPAEMPFLLGAMEKLAVEDPNVAVEVDRTTGECLLSGMGELHLEVALKLLSEYGGGVAIEASSPRVVYCESITRKSLIATAKSPDKQNKFVVQVEPVNEQFITLIAQGTTAREKTNVLAVDEQHKNVLINCTSAPMNTRGITTSLTSGFEYACKAGPLCGEPLRHVQVNLLKMQLNENAECCNPVEITHGVGKAIFGAVLTAKPVLLEPVYRAAVSVPTELAGECSRILSGRRGKISKFEQKGALAVIRGYIPVAETFGLAEEMRSATSGRAFWQFVLERWSKMPEKLASEVIAETRKQKGLPSEVPKPERFLEDA